MNSNHSAAIARENRKQKLSDRYEGWKGMPDGRWGKSNANFELFVDR